MSRRHRLGSLSAAKVLVMLLAGCETDDFLISGGTDDCPSSSGDAETDAAPTTSSVSIEDPPTEMTTRPGAPGRATPLDPTLPGPTPAQERR
jgi:hypothetical protein